MYHAKFTPLPPLTEDGDPGVFVEGVHKPTPLAMQSGVWIGNAGSAMLLQNRYALSKVPLCLWLIVEEGSLNFTFEDARYALVRGECLVIPANTDGCMLENARDARVLWMTLEGPLSRQYLREMNAFNRLPAKQGMLPAQVLLTRQIVQVMVRHTGTGDVSYQLAQLLWALIAVHRGQSVAMGATLSHEISRVVDAMRANQYGGSFSLKKMAAISRMPVETFRKRFSAEMGIPPLGYLQFQKMEHAKTLLRSGMNVRKTGVEIGMSDPYHFSKQFKQVVGMSPTAYLKHVGGEREENCEGALKG